MKNKKRLFIVCVISIIVLFTNACTHSNKEECYVTSKESIIKEDNLPLYYVEDIADLHLSENKFDISNYYIRFKNQYNNIYYIDEDNTLWGYGNNSCGQLGNGIQYTAENGYDSSYEMTPIKIAENCIHVDFSENHFVIYITESGDLYGIGANLNGLMGLDPLGNDYVNFPEKDAVATSPVLLMQNVQYARTSSRGITALKKDGSVWWWGEIRTTSAKHEQDTLGLSCSEPVKMLDDAKYITCGSFTMAAIKNDDSLWTWGNNTFGSCGYDSKNKDFIETPVKVLDEVKMVWIDQVSFNSSNTRFSLGIDPYECNYTYVTFVEKSDNSLWACGYGVTGEGSKIWDFDLYGDTLRSEDDAESPRIPDELLYSDIFQPIDFAEKDRTPQYAFKELSFGMTSEEVQSFLNNNNITYQIFDGTDDDGKPSYTIETTDQYFIFEFDTTDHKLNSICYTAYGTRDGSLSIGMTKSEIEKILGAPSSDDYSFEYNRYSKASYDMDSLYYEVFYEENIAIYIWERSNPL